MKGIISVLCLLTLILSFSSCIKKTVVTTKETEVEQQQTDIINAASEENESSDEEANADENVTVETPLYDKDKPIFKMSDDVDETAAADVQSTQEIVAEEVSDTSEQDNAEVRNSPEEVQPVYDWGITLSPKGVTATGMTLVISQSGGNPKGELNMGSAYKLWVFENNGWVELPYVLGDNVEIAWDDLAYVIANGASIQSKISWEYFYGSLKPGRYRIEKEILDVKSAGNYDKQVYFAEFSI